MLEKRSQFLSSEQRWQPKSLDIPSNIAGVEKIPLEILWLRWTLEAIWLEFWMKGALATEERFVFRLWLAIFKSVWYSVGDTLCSLPCRQTDWNIRIGKQGYVFILTDFKKWCFDVSFLTSVSVPTFILRLGEVEFLK